MKLWSSQRLWIPRREAASEQTKSDAKVERGDRASPSKKSSAGGVDCIGRFLESVAMPGWVVARRRVACSIEATPPSLLQMRRRLSR